MCGRKLLPRVSFLPVSLVPGSGKKIDPGNEFGVKVKRKSEARAWNETREESPLSRANQTRATFYLQRGGLTGQTLLKIVEVILFLFYSN